MSSPRPVTPAPGTEPTGEVFDVCVFGAGIIGMFNALQYAKRGLSVAIVDELSEVDKSAYKVGESLLIFSNAMLRSVGDLDNEISLSFDKRGLWFIYGYEGKKRLHQGQDALVTDPAARTRSIRAVWSIEPKHASMSASNTQR